MVLAVVLALAILLPAVPSGSLAAEWQISEKKGSDFCNNTYIAQKIQSLMDALVYSDAPYFTVQGTQSCGNTVCTQCLLKNVCVQHPNLKKLGMTVDVSAYGSGAFARYALSWIFDTKITAINYFGNALADGSLQTLGRVSAGKTAMIGDYADFNEANLKEIIEKGTPGDFLQARSSSGGNHSMILLSADSNGVTVMHSIDYPVEGIPYNKVVISTLTYGELMERWNQVISLIRVDSDSYATAWAKGENIHVTHIYTDEGQDACTVCGFTVSPVLSAKGAGVYAATVNTSAYKGYYRSTGTNGTSVAKGKYISVLGSVVNATGKTFYLLADGGYAAAEDFTSSSGTAPTVTVGTYPSGILPVGKSFNLSGTVKYSSGLSYVSGWFLKPDGTVVQTVKASTSATSYNIGSGTINANLRFGALTEGEYIYLIIACGRDGTMSSFKSEFTMRKESELPTPATPVAPTLAAKSSDSITLKAVNGYEYRRGNGSWQSSPAFTGLSAGTTYSFYQRVAATSSSKASAASPALTVTTDRSTVSAPPAPTLVSKTAGSVTLKAINGYEYRKGNGSWQSSPAFTGLSAGTTYSFYQRVAATSVSNASAESPVLTVTTDKKTVSAPVAPIVSSSAPESVTLKSVSGCEYSKNGSTWQDSPVFSGLTPGTSYTFYQRVKETGISYASASTKITVTTPKRTVGAPGTLSAQAVKDTSITLKSLGTGVEYSKDNGKTWQTSPLFSGLISNTSYTFVARYAETATSYAGTLSAAYTVKTDYTSVAAPAAPTLVSISGKTVTLRVGSGLQYSKDGGKTWQNSSVFTLPSYGTYSFVCRKAATDRCYASPASSALSVAVNPKTLTSDVWKVQEDSRTVCGIAAGTVGSELLKRFNENGFIALLTADGRSVSTSSAVCTGMILRLPEGETYTVVVKGDLDGDGEVSIFDLSLIRRYIVEGDDMQYVSLLAADVTEDGSADIFDYSLIRKYIVDGGVL